MIAFVPDFMGNSVGSVQFMKNLTDYFNIYPDILLSVSPLNLCLPFFQFPVIFISKFHYDLSGISVFVMQQVARTNLHASE